MQLLKKLVNFSFELNWCFAEVLLSTFQGEKMHSHSPMVGSLFQKPPQGILTACGESFGTDQNLEHVILN